MYHAALVKTSPLYREHGSILDAKQRLFRCWIHTVDVNRHDKQFYVPATALEGWRYARDQGRLQIGGPSFLAPPDWSSGCLPWRGGITAETRCLWKAVLCELPGRAGLGPLCGTWWGMSRKNVSFVLPSCCYQDDTFRCVPNVTLFPK